MRSGLNHSFMSRLSRAARFNRNDDGSTAVEFALVSVPFLMFIFLLIGVALYYFYFTSIEKGMDQTARLVRTGQAQKANMTVSDFKKQICDNAGSWVDCNNLQIFTQRFSDWKSVAPQNCMNSKSQVIVNNVNGDTPLANYSGTQSQIVIVTACYKWDFAKKIPFINFGNMPDGSIMMQNATAFRTEDYQ